MHRDAARMTLTSLLADHLQVHDHASPEAVQRAVTRLYAWMLEERLAMLSTIANQIDTANASEQIDGKCTRVVISILQSIGNDIRSQLLYG